MPDDEQIAMLVYAHVVQLTLIDYQPEEAFALAHSVAVQAFDPDFTRAGLEAARRTAETGPGSAAHGAPAKAEVIAPKA